MTDERDDYMRRQDAEHDMIRMRDPLGQRFGRGMRSMDHVLAEDQSVSPEVRQWQLETAREITDAAMAAPPPHPVTTHDLKVQTQFWDAVSRGDNRAQVRRADRKYRVNDVLLLREYDPAFGYTGRECRRVVTHVLLHEDVPRGVEVGWCVLSVRRYTVV